MFKKILIMGILLVSSNGYAAEITVSAAASLKDAFTQMVQEYQKQHPQDKIKLNTGASGALLQQLKQGAPVDVFATADITTMQKAEQGNWVHPSQVFAQNRLVLIVSPKSSLSLNKLNDLLYARRIAIGKPESVPAGKYAQGALQKANLYPVLNRRLVYTQNVRQALDYVVRGEVDAGFVYQTDAKLKPVKVLTHIDTEPVIYPIAVSKKTPNTTSAKRFVQYVLSPQGQNILQQHGFKTP